jgi:hypothetical protein
MRETEEILVPLLERFAITVLNFRAVFVESGAVARREGELCFLGMALRGGLGWALRGQCCDRLGQSASSVCNEACPQHLQCPYAVLFAPTPDPALLEKGPFRGAPQAPRPFSLRFDPLPQATVFGGQTFDFSITFLGDTVRHAGPVLMALTALGGLGLGRDRYRAPFRIISMTQVFPEGELLLWLVGNHEPLAHPSPGLLRSWIQEIPGESGQLELTLTSPLDLVFERRPITSMASLSAKVLMQRAFHRLWQLSVLWGNGSKPSLQNSAELTERLPVQVATGNSQHFRAERASHQERTVQRMRGIMGSALYSGEVATMHALLSLIRPLGLGQNTTAGFGRFDLRLLPF